MDKAVQINLLPCRNAISERTLLLLREKSKREREVVISASLMDKDTRGEGDGGEEHER